MLDAERTQLWEDAFYGLDVNTSLLGEGALPDSGDHGSDLYIKLASSPHSR